MEINKKKGVLKKYCMLFLSIKVFIVINILKYPFKKILLKFDKNKDNVISKREYKDLNFDKLNQSIEYVNKTKFSIDDITWIDLDLKNVFYNINYTVTTPGEECLYNWLKNPLDNIEGFNHRKNYINTYNNKDVVNKLRYKLAKIGYCKHNYKQILKEDFNVSIIMSVVFMMLMIINTIILVYSISIRSGKYIPIFSIFFIINLLVHLKFIKKYGTQVDVLNYILKLLVFSKKSKDIVERVDPILAVRFNKLNVLFKNVLNKGILVTNIEGLNILQDYLNIIFLVKEINFVKISRKLFKYKKEITEIFDMVGELDAILSIVEYRNKLNYYCIPDLNNNENNIFVSKMYHPLLDNPISNSININKSIAITGSNMSGKSTFLRTVGLNTIFAQSICTCLCEKYKAGFFRLVTSISLNDNILKGKSYFLMEAEAIKHMIAVKDNEYNSLFLIDEIFKGTNPVERLAAAMEILNLLALGNTRVLVATHDLHILPELVGYKYYYFTESITKDSLEFDYKLHSGVTTTRNAIKILQYINYPIDIVNKINNRINMIDY